MYSLGSVKIKAVTIDYETDKHYYNHVRALGFRTADHTSFFKSFRLVRNAY